MMFRRADGIWSCRIAGHEHATSEGAFTCMRTDNPKSRFLAVCAEWADLLIEDGAKNKADGHAITRDTEQMIPKVFYGEPQDYRTMAVIASDALLGREIGEGETEAKLIDDLAQKFADCITITALPDSQRKVWLAAWQLLLDSYDAAERESK